MKRLLTALVALVVCAAGSANAQYNVVPQAPAQIQAAVNAATQSGQPGGITALQLMQTLNQFSPFTNIWFDATNQQNGLLNVWSPGSSTWVPFVIPAGNLTGVFASPPCLGCSMPGPVFATSLSAIGTVSGVGFDTYTAGRLGAGLAGAFSTLSVSGTASFAGAVSGSGMDTYTAARIAAGLPGAFANLSSSGAVSGTGFDTYTALRMAAGLPGNFSTLVGASTTFADRAATLQSFGAKGDGIVDDTANVQTALRSGLPIYCRGKFLISSLVTVTNTSIDVEGGGDSCRFIYSTSQSMVSISETGNTLYTYNRVTLKGIRVDIGATITNVVGPAHTASFFISYPLGGSGVVSPSVIMDDVRVSPTAAPNYILNGLYINDAVDAHVSRFSYEGNRTTVDPNSNAVVWDGTHSPAILFLENTYADYVGKGLNAPQQNSGGWQGIRVKGFDCIFCGTAVSLQGALDGKTDYADISGVQGPVNAAGVSTLNVNHAFIHDNYVFLSSAINGLTNGATVVCYQMGWTIAIPTNSPSLLRDNACDGLQYTTIGATRYGEIINGIAGSPLAAILGPNINSNLDIGQSIFANTAGVTAFASASKGVTTAFQNLGTVGGNTIVPPLAVTDGSARAAGLVGEVLSSFIGPGGAVSLITTTPKAIAQVNLTPGDWDCRGDLIFNPNPATTNITLVAGSASTNALGLAPPGTFGQFFLPTAWQSGVAVEHDLGTFQINVSTSSPGFTAGSLPLYLVALSNFSTNIMQAYGNLECRRM